MIRMDEQQRGNTRLTRSWILLPVRTRVLMQRLTSVSHIIITRYRTSGRVSRFTLKERMFQDITGEIEEKGGSLLLQGEHSADTRVPNLHKGHTRASLREWRVMIVIGLFFGILYYHKK